MFEVANAAKHSALGAILYADPADFAKKGMSSNDVYPQTSWLPKSTILFGSAYARAGGGDPLTPDYPALEDMYRQPIDTADIPKIPAQTISYDDAKTLLNQINTGGMTGGRLKTCILYCTYQCHARGGGGGGGGEGESGGRGGGEKM